MVVEVREASGRKCKSNGGFHVVEFLVLTASGAARLDTSWQKTCVKVLAIGVFESQVWRPSAHSLSLVPCKLSREWRPLHAGQACLREERLRLCVCANCWLFRHTTIPTWIESELQKTPRNPRNSRIGSNSQSFGLAGSLRS